MRIILSILGVLFLAGWIFKPGTQEVQYVDEHGRPLPKEQAEAILRRRGQLPEKASANGACTADQANAVQTFIAANGYSCRSVSSCFPSVFGKSVSVRCNENYYSYTITDRGGVWSVDAH